MKKLYTGMLAMALAGSMLMTACGSGTASKETTAAASEAVTAAAASEAATTAAASEAPSDSQAVEINVFIAASLASVMDEIAANYKADHPDVTINYNADSSGTLMTQIEEGAACDIFFSAGQKQMNQLEEDGLLVADTRHNVVNNQLCVVKAAGAESAVEGLETLSKASSLALADGSVPVGKYTRTALVSLGILGETDTPEQYTTEEVSKALGGLEISEQSNVSKVAQAVIEGSCEVGTTYYSDTKAFEGQLDVIEYVSYDLTGNIIYPISMVTNKEASDAQTAAAKEFLDYVVSDACKTVFDAYLFDTNVD